LLDLVGGKSTKDVPCPFKGEVLQILKGKDWTTYEGLIHTDHNIRKEFFENREVPSSASRPYRNDFTYLYSQNQDDYVKFTAGTRVGEDAVYKEIGPPSSWTTRGGKHAGPSRTRAQEAEVRALLDVCARWEKDPPA
jgi:hypothetical protein